MKAFMLAAAALGSAPAHAGVRTASAHGFEIEHNASLPIPAGALYRLLATPSRWWSSEHTYSGDAANLSLQATPGGCWCEKLPKGGGIEHMRVAYVDPEKSLVLTGSLGPLLTLATSGVLQMTITATTTGSDLTLNYRVAGFYNGGAEKLAPIVDQVLGQQVARLSTAANSAKRP